MRLRLALLFLLAPAAAAQVAPPLPPAPRQLADEQTPAERSFLLASTLLANGRVDEATAMLEDLHAADPSAVAVWLKLEEAYVAGRRFDDLVRLVEDRIARDGRSVHLLAKKGVALRRADRPDEAARAWAEAVDLAPDDSQAYRVVANAVGGLRLYEEAAAILERGRQRLGDEVSALELAHVYGLALDYEQAVAYYLDALADDPTLREAIQARLTRLVSGAGAPEAFAAAFERAAALDPLDRGVRELQAWLALEQGDFDVALDAIRALDRLEREQGESLVAFARRARAAGAPEAAALALDEVLARHPDGPVASYALLFRAELHDEDARDGRSSEAAVAARDGYEAFLDRYPGHERAPAATLALADLLRDHFRDFDASEALLQRAANARDAGVASQARLTLAEVALQRGDLHTARQRFSDVDETLRIGTLAEQARYELALLDFYEGFMYSALARAEALDENTAADATNDAIALRVTLNEALDPEAMPGPDVDLSGEPLYVYGRAALRYRRGLHDEALATLDTLQADLGPISALADEALYLRASVLEDADRSAEAVAVLDRLIDSQPMSFFLDRALRRQARIYEADLGDPAAAAERWDRLLERFPGSPLAPEARQELRRLRSTPS